MGLAPLMLFTITLLIVRNQRILAAWNTRQEETARRAAQGLPPRTRRRRRKTLTTPAGQAAIARGGTGPREHAPHRPGHRDQTGNASMTANQPGARKTNRTNTKRPQHGGSPATPAAHRNVRPKRENRPH